MKRYRGPGKPVPREVVASLIRDLDEREEARARVKALTYSAIAERHGVHLNTVYEYSKALFDNG